MYLRRGFLLCVSLFCNALRVGLGGILSLYFFPFFLIFKEIGGKCNVADVKPIPNAIL